MLPFIELGTLQISSYIFMAAVAFLASSLLVFLRRKSQNVSAGDAIALSCMAFVGGVFVAKLFHIVGRALQGDSDGQFWTLQFWHNFNFFKGFVWYGGVIGALLFLLLYAKIRKMPLRNMLDLMTPFALSFDGIARFGCLFVGCCYGREASWGIKIDGITRLPSPLFESVLCFIILAEFLLWKPERKHSGILLPLYLVTYSTGRFVLEFFRGDETRGSFLIFSTSQWIALLILLTLVVAFIILRRKKKIA